MKVSIIIPIFKVEPYIAQCAESVLSQTWGDTEFIFVDDASPDHAVDILESLIDSRFQHLKDRIAIIRKPVNEGLPQARLTGLKAACGDYILHVDSDDWIEPDTVEKLAVEAERTSADVVYYYVCKEKGEGRIHIAKDRRYPSGKDFARAIMRRDAHGYLVCKFMRRSLYRSEFFYPRISMHEDIILAVQALSFARSVVLLPEALYHYRRTNPDAFTRQSRERRHRASARSFLQMYRFYDGFAATEELRWLREPTLDYCMSNFLQYDRENIPSIKKDFLALPPTPRRVLMRLWMRLVKA